MSYDKAFIFVSNTSISVFIKSLNYKEFNLYNIYYNQNLKVF